MIRAVLFDFYGIWVEEKFNSYLALAQQQNPEFAKEFGEIIHRYFLGLVTEEAVVNSLKFGLDMRDIDEGEFTISEDKIPSELIDLIRELHSHFLKVGIMANLGTQELDLIKSLDSQYKLFELIAAPITYGTPLLSKEFFVKSLNALGEPPRSCLLISAYPGYLDFASNFQIQTLEVETIVLHSSSLL